MSSLPRAAMQSKQSCCNNVANCHDPIIIGEDNNAIFVGCRECPAQERIGKDAKGNPENCAYSDFFKREIVQPDHPLYYKYAGAKKMRVI